MTINKQVIVDALDEIDDAARERLKERLTGTINPYCQYFYEEAPEYIRWLLAEMDRLRELDALGRQIDADEILKVNAELKELRAAYRHLCFETETVDNENTLLKDREKALQERCDALMEVVEVAKKLPPYPDNNDDLCNLDRAISKLEKGTALKGDK